MEENDNEGHLADQEDDGFSDNAAEEDEHRNESPWELSYFDSFSDSEDEWSTLKV